MTDIFWVLAAFLVGACVGSFLNVCVSRWPVGLSVISPPSRCPHCERPIRPWENVPVLGWIALRGRCAGCRAPISPQYPLIELAIGLLWLGAVLVYGPGLTALRVAVFLTVLTGVALTDARHYVIPDGFTVFGLVWVLLTALAGMFSPSPSPFAGAYDALIGACAGAGAIAITGWLGEVALKREAMGFGDATLMAVAGAALGPARALLSIFLAAALGVVVFVGIVVPISRLRQRHGATAPAGATSGVAEGEGAEPGALPLVPFGVFLAPAAAIALFAGDAMLRWYASRLLSP